MNKKQLDTSAIVNELANSAFFKRPDSPPSVPDTSTPRSQDTQTPRRPDPQTPRTPDVETPRRRDIQAPTFDLLEKAEERQTLRLTPAEFRRLGMVAAELGEALDVKKVDKNDIIRCALHRLFADIAPGVQKSDLLTRLRKKYR